MIKLNINDETSRLRSVLLGTARSNGGVPSLDEAYDPKSMLHIKEKTYPKEEDMLKEIEAVEAVFDKYGIQVFRPKVIQNYNQIFARDIGFVIDDVFIKANILPDREQELDAIQHVLSQIDPEKIIRFPEEAHIEGGDVMPHGDYIFVGTYRGEDYPDYIIARTNMKAVACLEKTFPNKKVVSFNLRKSNTNPYENALHLDCCFQPVGENMAILHKNGFLVEEEYQWLVDHFGSENVFEITAEEMFHMNSNIFSIAPDIVISERNFTRLNTWLRSKGITVEEVPYAEISKQEGLLRCSTLPLVRE
ncbi:MULTISPECIES: dimethylarginine dimethylaminohydrolase family protein [unclassified Leeuwenhoekiella]|uniref:dimethylarginine dimethylaminohydrolase family protein n=1 Tax=unclassified Leeuwenhoekiella TaxID=2615029 RepID=UPI000C3D67AC|nr:MULTISPECIES: arginine deiminase family protein [unclassified Leeuwenhoekiella]MAW95742.1 amidinotransferase [Leeuwenhoekiella sp.]MBA81183.1 amidinotransferase [Leeuwenhoekiella sp.]|tara:strand:+ start:7752 stop:8666 length:915 start_codon:yes stop_codon:yes gene_type:complete